MAGVRNAFSVLLVEDDEPIRALHRQVLEASRRFRVVGQAANGREAIAEAARTKADLVLLDLLMPVLGGYEALPGIRKASPRSNVVVVTMLPRDDWEPRVLKRGARAILDKSLSNDQLVEALLRIMNGHKSLDGRKKPVARSSK